MIVPTPIEQLPGFDSGESGTVQPGLHPQLKFIIIGGMLLVVAVSAAVMIKKRQDRIKKTKEQPWQPWPLS